MARIIFTGMHIRQIRKIIEGTGLTVEIAAGTGAVIFSYRNEVVTHKRANEIIDEYRRRRGIMPDDDQGPKSPPTAPAGVPPCRPTKPSSLTSTSAPGSEPSRGRTAGQFPIIMSKAEFRKKLKNSSGGEQFTGTQMRRLTDGARNLFPVIEANGWRYRDSEDTKISKYVSSDEAYAILVRLGRITPPPSAVK